MQSVVVKSGAEIPVQDTRETGGATLRPHSERKQSFEIIDTENGLTLRPSHYAYYPGGSSPRHRHLFEQLRFTIEGKVGYGRKTYPAGTLGYFPESVYYGPSKWEHESTRDVVLQFPAPSGVPFFNGKETKRATDALKVQGVEFINGICHFPAGKKQDSPEAIYEYLTGHKADYAPPRYDEPVFVYSPGFPWASNGRQGVATKQLGYFNECGPNVILVHLEPGASTPRGSLGCMQIRFVIEGEVEYAGKACPAVSCLYYPPGAAYEGMVSPSGATVLVIQLKSPEGEAPPLSVI